MLQAMEHDSEYAIGKFPKIDNQLLEQALPALTQLKEICPGWRLLASAAQVLKLDLQAVLARESERKDLPIARLWSTCVKRLVEHGNHNQAVSAAHWLYLSVFQPNTRIAAITPSRSCNRKPAMEAGIVPMSCAQM